MDAEDVKAWRAREGLSQAGAAERLGVTRLTVSRWENGARVPSKAADAMGAPNVGAAARAVAKAAGEPVPEPAAKTTTRSIRADPEFWSRAEAAARAQGLSFNSWALKLMHDSLGLAAPVLRPPRGRVDAAAAMRNAGVSFGRPATPPGARLKRQPR